MCAITVPTEVVLRKFWSPLRHAVTLTFDPLTLNIHGRWCAMFSIYVPNLSEIAPAAAELLTINDRFFVHFRGCSNTAGAVSKMRGPICTKFGADNVFLSGFYVLFFRWETIFTAKTPSWLVMLCWLCSRLQWQLVTFAAA